MLCPASVEYLYALFFGTREPTKLDPIDRSEGKCFWLVEGVDPDLAKERVDQALRRL